MVDYAFTWMMVFLRGMGVVLLMPAFAGYSPPVMLRVGFNAFLATLVAGVVPLGHVPSDLWHLGGAAAGETLLGLALGYICSLVFGAVDFAGRLMSSEVGLSAAPEFHGPDISSAPLASLITAFAGILFFLVGGQLAVVGAVVRSFDFAAPGHPAIGRGGTEEIVVATARVIELGVRMAAPFIGLNFLLTLAFAAIGRTLPRMPVFVVSLSARALLGLGLLASAGTLIARHLFSAFQDLPVRLLELVAVR
jgi:flagellar biosynthetic protein FliR